MRTKITFAAVAALAALGLTAPAFAATTPAKESGAPAKAKTTKHARKHVEAMPAKPKAK